MTRGQSARLLATVPRTIARFGVELHITMLSLFRHTFALPATLFAVGFGAAGCSPEGNEGRPTIVLFGEGDLASNVSIHTLVGTTDGGVIASGQHSPTDNVPDGFLARFDAELNEVWARSFWTSGWLKFARGSGEELYVAGSLSQDQEVMGAKLTASAFPANFILKLDGQGKLLWQKVYDEGRGAFVTAFTADDKGVILGGTYTTGFSIDGENLAPASPGASPVFLVQVDAAGKLTSATSHGGSYATIQTAARNPDGSVVVAGTFYGTLSFGGSPMAASSTAIYFAKLDTSGKAEWSHHFYGSGTMQLTRWGTGHAVSMQGKWIDLGIGRWLNGQVTARLEGDGHFTWARELGRGSYSDSLPSGGVVTGGAASYYVTGRTVAAPTGESQYGSSSYDRDVVALDDAGNVVALFPLGHLDSPSYPRTFSFTESAPYVYLAATDASYNMNNDTHSFATKLRRLQVNTALDE